MSYGFSGGPPRVDDERSHPVGHARSVQEHEDRDDDARGREHEHRQRGLGDAENQLAVAFEAFGQLLEKALGRAVRKLGGSFAEYIAIIAEVRDYGRVHKVDLRDAARSLANQP